MISEPKLNRNGRPSKRGRTGMSRLIFDHVHDMNAPERSYEGYWEAIQAGEVLARSKSRINLERWYRREMIEGSVEVRKK